MQNKLCLSFGVTYCKICGVRMKWQSLKDKRDCLFWSSAKRRKGFTNINDSDKSSLQKWIIYQPNVLQYPIANDCIKVKFDNVNGGVKTELNQKVLLQVYGREIHIDMLLVFPWHMVKKDLYVLVVVLFE